MIRRRLAVALVAATGTTLALVSPVQAEESTSSVDAVSSLSSTSSNDTTAPTEDSNLPEWAGSLALDDDAALAFEIIQAVMAVGMAVTQAAVVVLPFIPGGVDQLRETVEQLGL
ncbi:hypothetical protein [Corynebacterium sp.]|uniref:hypothetical protein n=1 Tax=Corynebacterium sp. TaxID=1720 RepID=UPI0026E1137D|nr:hypothetical protein [Corynebacterium sp.]MDO5513412.1 hypothetical protein [Corynebacterium sp.]